MRPCALALLLVGIAAAPAQENQPSDADIVRKGKSSTALIEIGEGRGFGSAFCIDERGFFLSNAHVIPAADAGAGLILSPGEKDQKKLAAKVLRRDPDADLALLKVDGPGKFGVLALGSDEGLIETSEVMAFGFPFGADLASKPGEYPSISVNKGRITALRRKDGSLNRIQLDAVLNPGNSGGPVVNKTGDVVGVVVSGIQGAGAVNFAIPVSHVKKFLESPAIAFATPDLSPAALGEPAEFRVTLSPSLLTKTTYAVELIIRDGKGPDRKFDMKPAGDGYSVKAAPSPGAKGQALRLDAAFFDGQVSGLVDDFEFTVGGTAVRLRDVGTVKTGDRGTVTLRDGRTLEGAVKKLDSVSLRIGGQTVVMNLASATEIIVSAGGPAVTLTFTIVVRSAGKEVARAEETVELGDGEAVTSGAGLSSLESLIEGKFIRPGRSSAKTNYLNVLSTAGDYIGGGKRYEYDAKAIQVDPAEGHVRAQAGGWHLDVAPAKGKILKVGEYDGAKRFPFNDASPGLSFSGNGRGSNTLAGKFVVWEFVVKGGKVTSLAIDFIQFSEGKKAAPLAGMLRYNSSFK